MKNRFIFRFSTNYYIIAKRESAPFPADPQPPRVQRGPSEAQGVCNLSMEPRRAHQEATLEIVQNRHGEMRPDGFRCFNQNQKRSRSNPLVQEVVSRRYLWIVRHEYQRNEPTRVLVVRFPFV